MILLSSPLKNDPLQTTVSLFFFLEIEILTTIIVNSKSLRKICRRLLSTMNLLKVKYKMVALCPRKPSPFKLEVQKNACLALIIQIMWLKQNFLKKEQSYVNISYLLQQHTKLF